MRCVCICTVNVFDFPRVEVQIFRHLTYGPSRINVNDIPTPATSDFRGTTVEEQRPTAQALEVFRASGLEENANRLSLC
jgi:hypothetical protein